MAITFVGGATAGKAGATSGNTTIALNSGLTGGSASAVSAGDLVIAIFGTGSVANRTLAITDGTTNYTLIDSELYSDDTLDTNLRIAYKFMGGTPDASTTFGPTGDANDSGAMAVYVFRGVDTGTPLDVAAVPATGIDTSRANPPSIQPTTAGAFIVCVGAAGHNGGVDTFTSSDLTSFRTQGGTNDTNDVTIGVGHINNWTSGAFNAAAFGHSQADSTSFSWAAMSIVLRPQADTTDDLLANSVQSTSNVVAPNIGQTHVILANDVQSVSELSLPTLNQVHALLSVSVSSLTAVSNPALSQIHLLVGANLQAVSELSVPGLIQTHILIPTDIQSISGLSAPNLNQTHVLLADNVQSTSNINVPTININNNLIYQTRESSYRRRSRSR